MDEEKELALRKYAELYEHSKAVLAEELSRSHRADEKASKYLTVLVKNSYKPFLPLFYSLLLAL